MGYAGSESALHFSDSLTSYEKQFRFLYQLLNQNFGFLLHLILEYVAHISWYFPAFYEFVIIDDVMKNIARFLFREFKIQSFGKSVLTGFGGNQKSI